MSDELGIPSSLSAQASLDVAIAMGGQVAKDRANHHHLDHSMNETDIQPHITHKITSSASVDTNYNVLPCSDLVYDVSQTIERLQHHAGVSTPYDNNSSNMSAYEKDTHQQTFVETLSDADDRLKSCLHEASVVRTALHSLRNEETLTEMAVRDYDDRPAQHL